MKRLSQYFIFAGAILLAVTFMAACTGSREASPEPTTVFQAVLPSLPSPTPAVLSPTETEIAAEPVITTVPVETLLPDAGSLIDGAESTLTRMPHGVYMTFKTSGLTPNDAVTMWWIIFNRPENCSNGECGQDDAFQVDENGQTLLDEAGNWVPNLERREAVGWSSLRADGKVVEEGGSAEFRGHLPIGDATEAVFGPGLLDSMKAEFHLIARTHGPAIPGGTHNQLNTAWGGCEPGQFPCVEIQIAVHRPPGP
jgi:hypothetical protein